MPLNINQVLLKRTTTGSKQTFIVHIKDSKCVYHMNEVIVHARFD